MALVEYGVEGGIATFTLNAPKPNCYTYEMMRDLDECILRARLDDAVHAIVIAGAGDFFCAGADIKVLASVTPRFKYWMCLHANETLCRLEQTPKLVIAAMNGATVGGGLEIAMAADLRIARKGIKIGLPEVALGVLPGTGGTQRLARIVGKSRAIELMASGRLFETDEALRLGIVDYAYDAGDRASFLRQVFDYARGYLPPAKASKAVGMIKRAVQSGVEVGYYDALAIEREAQQQLFQSEDAREGLAAYVEKRKPAFKGL